MQTRCTLAIASIIAVCGSAASAQSIPWLSPVDGNWNESAKWDMSNIPNDLAEIAVLGHTGVYTVFTSANWSVGGISITNPDAVLSIGSNQHTLFGDVFNEGTIVVNTSASVFNGSMYFGENAALFGRGTVVLNGPSQVNDAAISVDPGKVLTHHALHTIRGSGQLLGSMINDGLIVADDPAGVGLSLDGELNQGGLGLAGAENGARLLLGANGDTIGGELFTNSGGEIYASGNNHRLNGVNLTGDLVIPGDSRTLIAENALENNGSISINPELNVFNATLQFDTSMTIAGTGTINLASTGDYNDARLLSASSSNVTIGSGQLVQGSGLINAGSFGSFLNAGTINANDPAQPLGLEGAHIGAGGIYRADGGELNLRGNSSVSNAVFDSSGTGRVELDISGSATVTNSTNLGTMIVRGNGGTLLLEGSLTNDGVVQVNPENSVFNANIETQTGLMLGGSGSFDMTATTQPADAALKATNNATLTIGSGQTVQGSGKIAGNISQNGLVVNLGTINGNHAAFDMNPAYALQLEGNHDGMGVGVYRSDNGILLLDSNSVVQNAIFDSSGAGYVGAAHAGNNDVGSIINQGTLNVEGNGGTFSLIGDLTNNGVVQINSNSNVFNATVRAQADVSILGTGEVRMITAGNLNDAQLFAGDGFTLTIGFDQTVAGSGVIEGRGTMGVVVNNGLILADDPTANLDLDGTHSGTVMAGSGIYRAIGNSVLGLRAGTYLNGGILETEDNGEIAAAGGVSQLAYATNNGNLGVWGNGVSLELIGSLINDGTITINSNGNNLNANLRLTTADLEISGTGEIVLEEVGNLNDAQFETSAGVTGVIGENQTITGSGQINGSFNVLGTIDPAGTMRIFTTDNITLADSSHMIFDLGGDLAPDFDRINVRGASSMALDGTATVNLEPGYAPTFGDTWDVIDGPTTGTFDEVVTGIAPPGQVYRMIYENNRVFVILTCDADLSGDGVIDFFDVSAFLSYFSAQDVRGDLNNDGVFNFFDVSVFLQLYGQGCNP